MPKPLKALIIEDENLAAQRLKKLLLPYQEEVQIVGEASDGKEGLALIEELQPDFIFLDIQMPVMTGLEMIMQLEKQPFIIFTTAYDEYALRSFEENSIDYLLKPIQPKRLDKAIKKLLEITALQQPKLIEVNQLQEIVSQLQEPKTLRMIRAKVGDKIVMVRLENVLYLKAEDKLTTVVTTDGKEYYITPSLSTLLPKLPENFMQVNRAHIINEDGIYEIRKTFNRKLLFEMSNNEKITASSAFSGILKERWNF